MTINLKLFDKRTDGFPLLDGSHYVGKLNDECIIAIQKHKAKCFYVFENSFDRCLQFIGEINEVRGRRFISLNYKNVFYLFEVIETDSTMRLKRLETSEDFAFLTRA